jgi:hypothetical protein
VNCPQYTKFLERQILIDRQQQELSSLKASNVRLAQQLQEPEYLRVKEEEIILHEINKHLGQLPQMG